MRIVADGVAGHAPGVPLRCVIWPDGARRDAEIPRNGVVVEREVGAGDMVSWRRWSSSSLARSSAAARNARLQRPAWRTCAHSIGCHCSTAGGARWSRHRSRGRLTIGQVDGGRSRAADFSGPDEHVFAFDDWAHQLTLSDDAGATAETIFRGSLPRGQSWLRNRRAGLLPSVAAKFHAAAREPSRRSDRQTCMKSVELLHDDPGAQVGAGRLGAS